MSLPTITELKVICQNLALLEMQRLLTGPLGREKSLQPDDELAREEVVLIGLASWFKSVPKFDEVKIQMVIGRMLPDLKKRLRQMWDDLDQSERTDALISSFFVGVIENRWVSWSNLQSGDAMDVESGEIVDQIPHKHMWVTTLDLAVLTGRMWGEVKQLKERTDAGRHASQNEAARS